MNTLAEASLARARLYIKYINYSYNYWSEAHVKSGEKAAIKKSLEYKGGKLGAGGSRRREEPRALNTATAATTYGRLADRCCSSPLLYLRFA